MKKIILCLALFSLCTFAQAQRKTKIVEPVTQENLDTGGKVIKRKGVIRVICENPKHKQRQG